MSDDLFIFDCPLHGRRLAPWIEWNYVSLFGESSGTHPQPSSSVVYTDPIVCKQCVGVRAFRAPDVRPLFDHVQRAAQDLDDRAAEIVEDFPAPPDWYEGERR